MADIRNPVQTGIYARLDAQLTESVYDFVPQGTTFPYVRIGLDDYTYDGTKTSDGVYYAITIHTFDKAAGTKSVNVIMDKIRTALHNQEDNVTITGWKVVRIQEAFSTVVLDDINDTGGEKYYHGIQRFEMQLSG